MQEKITIITPSYKDDHALAVSLCQSIDTYVQGEFDHILMVPTSDMALFSPLASPRRKIFSQDALLKRYGIYRLPIPTRFRVPGIIDFRIRQQWYAVGAGRINGWVVQQILKLSTPDLTETETLLFIDSDVELIRPFHPACLWRDGAMYLHEHRGGATLPTHIGWRATARKILGISDPGEQERDPRNYISQLIPWRRSNVIKLQNHIMRVQRLDWRKAITRNSKFSEYILYGTFCRFVLREESGHVFADLGLCNSVWSSDGEIEVQSVLNAATPSQVAFHIQSTIKLAPEKRRALISGVVAGFVERSAAAD